jgi:DivIVA domain-containing protein
LFWFMLIALVVVVAAVALAVLGDGAGALKDPDPDRIDDRLPPDRPLLRSDIDEVRLPVAVRGYRMLDVDEVLDRLGAELAERDARIAELEASLAGVRAGAVEGGSLEGAQPDAQYGPEGPQDAQNGVQGADWQYEVPGADWQHGIQPHGATLLKGGTLPPTPDQGHQQQPGDTGE